MKSIDVAAAEQAMTFLDKAASFQAHPNLDGLVISTRPSVVTGAGPDAMRNTPPIVDVFVPSSTPQFAAIVAIVNAIITSQQAAAQQTLTGLGITFTPTVTP